VRYGALPSDSENEFLEINSTITSPAGSSKAPDKRRSESFSDHSKKIPFNVTNKFSAEIRGLSRLVQTQFAHGTPVASSLSSATGVHGAAVVSVILFC
jgi:hypothetical protein